MTIQDSRHPLVMVVGDYYRGFDDLKADRSDLSLIDFNVNNYLRLDVPSGWPVIEAIQEAVWLGIQDRKRVTIVYSSTKVYKSLYMKGLDPTCRDDVAFISCAEIYQAADLARTDRRHFDSIRSMLTSSGLIICVDIKHMSEVVRDQILGTCDSCIMFFGMPGE